MMDSLSQVQLTNLETGGNQQLYKFFDYYDLNSETIQKRYFTKAAEFYRLKLKELCEKGVSKDGKGLDFTTFDDKPNYEEGRVILTINQPRHSVDS
jgi:hypothetical protein